MGGITIDLTDLIVCIQNLWNRSNICSWVTAKCNSSGRIPKANEKLENYILFFFRHNCTWISLFILDSGEFYLHKELNYVFYFVRYSKNLFWVKIGSCMWLPWKLLDVVAVFKWKQRLPQESQAMESAFIQSASNQVVPWTELF